MSLATGQRLGPYEIVELLHAVKGCKIYNALDEERDRRVTIRVLPKDISDNPERCERFEQEVRGALGLNHPRIGKVFDLDHRDGIDFLVLEHLEGELLQTRLKQGALSLEPALRHGCEIAEALAKAHGDDMVHQALSPAKVLLTESGAVLLDFGLARLDEDWSAGQSKGGFRGKRRTPIAQESERFAYLAPEQLDGKGADERSDLFALGGILHEMLTGRKAFTGEGREALTTAIRTESPPPVTRLEPRAPTAVDHVVRSCLAKDPEKRWQSARDLCLELNWIRELLG